MKKVMFALGLAVAVGLGVQAALASQQPIKAGVGPSTGKVVGSAVVPGAPPRPSTSTTSTLRASLRTSSRRSTGLSRSRGSPAPTR